MSSGFGRCDVNEMDPAGGKGGRGWWLAPIMSPNTEHRSLDTCPIVWGFESALVPGKEGGRSGVR